MLFTGTHNETANFELHAFESCTEMGHMTPDDDWLEIKLDVITTRESWHVIDPSLTAAEVKELVDWLYNLSCSKPVTGDLYFLEPTLSFHHVRSRQGNTTLKIIFYNELRPSWYPENEECAITCCLHADQLQMLAADLLHDVETMYIKAGCEEIDWSNQSFLG